MVLAITGLVLTLSAKGIALALLKVTPTAPIAARKGKRFEIVYLKRFNRTIPRPELRSGGHCGPEASHRLCTRPKPPIPLPAFYMLSHLEKDGPVRLDGVKLGICEVMGLELDEPRLGSFAGALNALDFPVQLLRKATPAGAGPPEG